MLRMIPVSERFRPRFPKPRRSLARIQVPSTSLMVAPSGLWMADDAAAGSIAAMGLAVLDMAADLDLGGHPAEIRLPDINPLWVSKFAGYRGGTPV
jgi:hypothetical protein